MPDAASWAKAYARQAEADFGMFQTLQALPSVRTCHRLQFLQMACEKLVKAHLCGKGTDPAALQGSHAFIAGTLPVVLRAQAIAVNFDPKKARRVLQQVKFLAQEIELLAPAVKRGGQRPDNCEYPWVDDSEALHVPLDWSFTPVNLLEAPAGRSVLKLIFRERSRACFKTESGSRGMVSTAELKQACACKSRIYQIDGIENSIPLTAAS